MNSVDLELEQLKQKLGLSTNSETPEFPPKEETSPNDISTSTPSQVADTEPFTPNGYGLVLSGGGGKGAYEIGALTALDELGLLEQVTMISGNSIGSVNMVLYEGGGLEKAQKLWFNIDPSDFIELDDNGYDATSNDDGIFSREGLTRLVTQNADLSKISNSNKQLYITVCKDNPDQSISAEYVQMNEKNPAEIMQYVLASSAIPIVYDAVNINGVNYFDGGLKDNTPIQPLYNAGMKEIIVICLDHDYVDKSYLYPSATCYNIIPSQSLDMNTLTGTADLSKTNAVYRYRLGYLDTKAIMNAYLNHLPIPDLSSHHTLAMQDLTQAKLNEQINSEFSTIDRLMNQYGITDEDL